MRDNFKPYIVIFSGVIFLLLIIWGVLFFLQKKTYTMADNPGSLIPSDALFLITVETPATSIDEIKETVFWQELAGIKQLQQIDESAVFPDSIIKGSTKIQDFFNSSMLYLSFHEVRQGLNAGLFNITPKRKYASKDITGLLKEELDLKILNQYQFLDALIFEGHLPKSDTAFYSFYKGSLLISSHRKLVETSITQYNSGTNLLSDKDFKDIFKISVSGNKVFYNIGNLCDDINKLIKLDKHDFLDCKNFGSWLAWDINVYDQHLTLNGFLTPAEGQNVIPTDNPLEHKLLPVLPSTTFLFISQTSGDQGLDKNDQMSNNPAYNDSASENNEIYGSNNISDMPVKQTGYALYAINKQDKEIAPVFVINLEDEVPANELAKDYGLRQLNIREYFAEEYNLHLYRINKNDFLNDFEVFGLSNEYKYLLCYGNLLVALESIDDVKSWYDYYKNKRMLSDNPYTEKIFEQLPAISNYLIYTHIPDLISLMDDLFTKEARDFLAENNETVKRFDRAAVQLMHQQGGMFLAHAVLSHNPGALNTPEKKWEVELNDNVHERLYKVISHVDNTREIIVTDSSNTIYLVSDRGELLWERELKEQLMSDIFQIDYYKNDKYQYLFNTQNYIYLIDRLGRNVANYPLRLQESASAPMAVFDYDNNKNYRLIIPAESKKILNLDKTGSPVAGWMYERSGHVVRKPVQHIRMEGKDFLFVIDNTGRSEILNRRGQVRIKTPKELKISNKNHVFYDPTADKPHFMITGNNGQLIEIALDGTISKFAIDEFSEEHFFAYHDFTRDGKKEYLFLDENVLSVFDYSGKKLFSYKFDNDIDVPPFVFDLNKKGLFAGVVDKNSGKIYLFSGDGRNMLPLVIRGDVPFEIKTNEKKEVIEIVKGLNNFLRCYEILF